MKPWLFENLDKSIMSIVSWNSSYQRSIVRELFFIFFFFQKNLFRGLETALCNEMHACLRVASAILKSIQSQPLKKVKG